MGLLVLSCIYSTTIRMLSPGTMPQIKETEKHTEISTTPSDTSDPFEKTNNLTVMPEILSTADPIQNIRDRFFSQIY